MEHHKVEVEVEDGHILAKSYVIKLEKLIMVTILSWLNGHWV